MFGYEVELQNKISGLKKRNKTLKNKVEKLTNRLRLAEKAIELCYEDLADKSSTYEDVEAYNAWLKAAGK